MSSEQRARHGVATAVAHTHRPGPVRVGESGAALVLVMAFLLVIMVVSASLFSLATAGTTSLKTYQEDRTLRYGADGALEHAVQRVADDTTLGVSPTGPCGSWVIPIEGRTSDDDIFAAGSKLTVTCQAYQDSSALDTDGGQQIRFVSFTVTCAATTGIPRAEKPACGTGGSQDRVVARAQVRYDIDFRKTGPDVLKRAVIPKIISWDLQR